MIPIFQYKTNAFRLTREVYIILQIFSYSSSAIHYKNDLSEVSQDVGTVSYLLPIFKEYCTPHIVFDDGNISGVFVERVMKQGTPLLIIRDLTKTTQTETSENQMCDSAVIFVATDLEKCPVVNVSKRLFYVTSKLTSANFSALASCFTPPLTGEILIFFLRDQILYRSSYSVKSPRRFVKTNISEAIGHRRTIKRHDHGGDSLVVATMDYPPFMMIKNGSKSEVIDGIEVQLFREVCCQLNLSLQYKNYEMWGFLSSDGLWKGFIGQAMQDGKADVAVANIWEDPELYSILDFGPPLTQNRVAFLVRRPELLDFQWRAFVTIFQPTVWLATLVAFGLVLATYKGCIYWDPRPIRESWTHSTLTVFGLLTTMSSYSRVTDGNSRPVLIAWSIFSLSMATILASGIITSLTLPLYSARVDTVRQLVEGKFYWTVDYYVRFKNKTSAKHSLFDFKDEWNVLFEKQFKVIDYEKTQFLADSDKKITFMVQTYGNDLLIINSKGLLGHKALSKYRITKSSVASKYVSFGVRKNSPLLKLLTYTTQKILEGGFLQHWKTEVINRWPVYDTRQLLKEEDGLAFSERLPLKLAKTQPVFYLLLIGLTVSFIVFVFELLLL